MIPTCIPTSAIQKEAFPLAGMLRVVKFFGVSGFNGALTNPNVFSLISIRGACEIFNNLKVLSAPALGRMYANVNVFGLPKPDTNATYLDVQNHSEPDIIAAPAGVSLPVRECKACSPTVISSLNEYRLTVLRVSNEARLGVIAPSQTLTILKMVSTADPQSVGPLKKECAGCLEPAKKNLPIFRITVYGNSAPAKSGAGIGVPEIITATPDAPSVFFCVVHSVHPFFCVAVIIRAAHEIMVGCVGASFEAPVSVVSGYANPIQSTTLEIGVSGGGYPNHTSEAALWLLPPPKNHLLSGAFTLASNHAISLLPLALSQKPDPCYLIAHACLLLVSAQGALMLNQFTVLGYGTNKRGLTVGINYQITSDSTAKATAHAMLQAQRNGLTRITITRVMGATA